MQKQANKHGVALLLTLDPQDAAFLRAAIADGPDTSSRNMPQLAQAALGTICRTIIREGYRPRPILAELVDQAAAPAPDSIKIQLP